MQARKEGSVFVLRCDRKQFDEEDSIDFGGEKIPRGSEWVAV